MEPTKKFHINTFGCQMNVADTEKMQALLSDAGMEWTEEPTDADLILVNGCSVREKAVHKAVSALGVYHKDSKKEGMLQAGKKKPLLGLGGCVGQLDKGSIFTNAPYVDFVFGPDAIDELPEIIHRVESGERHAVYTEFDSSSKFTTETRVFGQKAQAFVNIMKGCDKYCTYCIVPYTRGREKSRTIDEVLDDLAGLVKKGIREVTLLGQNVNSFGKGNPNTKNREPQSLQNVIGRVGPQPGHENFPQLLHAIDQDPRLVEIKRIRFTSSHPLDFSDELIDCYLPADQGGVEKLARHLHLPVQSGSNEVLRKMGRKHKIENYIAQMERLREIAPDVGISTDLIVGFPDETEEHFQETVALLDRIRFDNIYAFAYSVRPGTRAAKREDNVSAKDKNDRLNRLLQHQLTIAKETYADRVGKVMEILVEGTAKNQKMVTENKELATEGARVWSGRTSCNRVVNFISDSPRNLTGQFLDVRITDSTSLSLYGELADSPEPTFAERQGMEVRPL